VIKNRLERFIKQDLLLSVIQDGFRRSRSCEDYSINITLVNLKIYRSLFPVGGLFVDIKVAYDNVNLSIFLILLPVTRSSKFALSRHALTNTTLLHSQYAHSLPSTANDLRNHRVLNGTGNFIFKSCQFKTLNITKTSLRNIVLFYLIDLLSALVSAFPRSAALKAK